MPVDTSSPTYADLPKLGRHYCRDCEHHVMEARVRSVNVIRCDVTNERVTGFQRACCLLDPSPALVRRLAHQVDRIAQTAINARQQPLPPTARLRAGDKCPKCGSRLLGDYGSVYCLMCGTKLDATPWEPSPSGNIWPPRGFVDAH
jgi:hypothetical protein